MLCAALRSLEGAPRSGYKGREEGRKLCCRTEKTLLKKANKCHYLASHFTDLNRITMVTDRIHVLSNATIMSLRRKRPAGMRVVPDTSYR